MFEQQEEIEIEDAPSWFPDSKEPALTIHDVDWETTEELSLAGGVYFGFGAAFFLVVFVALTIWWTRK